MESPNVPHSSKIFEDIPLEPLAGLAAFKATFTSDLKAYLAFIASSPLKPADLKPAVELGERGIAALEKLAALSDGNQSVKAAKHAREQWSIALGLMEEIRWESNRLRSIL